MDDEMRSAAAPRWRGAAGRLEVWYATLSDPLTRAGLWIHCETVSPPRGSGDAQGPALPRMARIVARALPTRTVG